MFSATEKPENAPAYCARSGGRKSLAIASSAMTTKAPIATLMPRLPKKLQNVMAVTEVLALS